MTSKSRARLGSPLRLHGSFELFGLSAKLVQKNIWIFAPLFALPLLFTFHAWEWTPALGGNLGHHWTRYSWLGSGFSSSIPYFLWYSLIGYSILWLVFVVLAGTAVQIMIQQAQLEAIEKKPLDLVRLWRSAKANYRNMLGLYLLMGLYILAGLILFIIPGLIMLRRYFLAPYVMLDTKCDIKTAMERSAEIGNPYSGYIWGVIVVMTFIGLLNAIPGVGWMVAFALGMFYCAAPALRYQELKEVHGGRQRPMHHHEDSSSDINSTYENS
jgi:hypothetical protein